MKITLKIIHHHFIIKNYEIPITDCLWSLHDRFKHKCWRRLIVTIGLLLVHGYLWWTNWRYRPTADIELWFTNGCTLMDSRHSPYQKNIYKLDYKTPHQFILRGLLLREQSALRLHLFTAIKNRPRVSLRTVKLPYKWVIISSPSYPFPRCTYTP